MSSPPQTPSPNEVRAAAFLAKAGRWVLRAASIAFGLAIEVQQVYGTDQAQWALIFLGLWFIGVPPALWFDGVWRLARIASVLEQSKAGPPAAPAAPAPPPPPQAPGGET
jgi:hypothetical protein